MSSVFFGLLIRDYNMMLATLTTVGIVLSGGLLTWFTIFRESNTMEKLQ